MILLIHNGYNTFVKKDYEMLNKNFKTKKFFYNPKRNLVNNLVNQTKLFFWLFFKIWRTKIIYIWFADYHAFLPVLFAKIFKKKSIIIVGGYDAVSIPELKFGVFYDKNKKIRILFTKFSYRNADYILPVDKTLIQGINYYVSKDGLPIGVKQFVKNLKGKFKIVPTGYNPDIWYRKKDIRREKIVLSIGGVPDIRTFKRKGFDFLIEIAQKMPEVKFEIIGLSDNILRYAQRLASNNVRLVGFAPNNQLINFYSQAKVFCQLSLSEGLPNTLCEAMLCECIPVGSDVNGIPTAINDCGFILKEKNVDKAVGLIKKALNSDGNLGKKARQRIISNYSFEKREKEITLLIKKLMN